MEKMNLSSSHHCGLNFSMGDQLWKLHMFNLLELNHYENGPMLPKFGGGKSSLYMPGKKKPKCICIWHTSWPAGTSHDQRANFNQFIQKIAITLMGRTLRM